MVYIFLLTSIFFNSDLIIPFADPLAGTSQYAWALKINIRALAECNASTAVSDVRERALRVVHSAFMLRKHGASEDVPAPVLQAVDRFFGTVTAEPTHSNFKFPGPIDATQFARAFSLGKNTHHVDIVVIANTVCLTFSLQFCSQARKRKVKQLWALFVILILSMVLLKLKLKWNRFRNEI